MTGSHLEEESVSGVVDPRLIDETAAVLDLEVVDLPSSGELPPMWHAGLLIPVASPRQLNSDGHRRNGVPRPPAPGLTRMFAGGTVKHIKPLHCGAQATRLARVVESREKEGRSGPLAFVTVQHTVTQGEEVCVQETQDIVYRSPSDRTQDSPSATPPAESGFHATTTALFQFSALTKNSHRIHYDRDFARAEGYPGLVVHGPLQALLLAEHIRRQGGSLLGRTFEYRLVAPAFENDCLQAIGYTDLSLRTSEGRTTAVARLF